MFGKARSHRAHDQTTCATSLSLSPHVICYLWRSGAGTCAGGDQPCSEMLLTNLYLLAVVLSVSAMKGADDSEVRMPFDFFLGPDEKELAETRPLEFNPDEGHIYRRQYEDKYGYRGERLIAMLGGNVAPLAIYDAALLGQKTIDHSDNTTTSETPTTEHSPPSTEESSTAPANGTAENQSSSDRPIERKYVEIDRKHNGFLTESFLENNIPQEQSYRISPEGIVYKRLYGAIWNYGAKGLPRVALDEGINGKAIPRRLGFDGGFSGLENLYPPIWGGLNFGSQLTLPAAQEIEDVNKQSQKEFAGPGEPSILVQSYSY